MQIVPSQPKSVVAAAVDYWRLGLRVIPLEPREKRPIGNDWPQRLYSTESEVVAAFGGGVNLGVVLGAASGGIIDVDVDDERAAAVALGWMPPTTWTFSRNATESMHFVYKVRGEVPAVERFSVGSGKKQYTFIEVRGTGGQTMFPPSIHPDGEGVQWLSWEGGRSLPTEVDTALILRKVEQFAAAAAIARSWPAPGRRHDAALALAGGLARAEWTEEEIVEFIRLVCAMAGENEKEVKEDRLPGARSSIEQLRGGKPVSGWKSLVGYLKDGEDVVKKACEWLHVGRGGDRPEFDSDLTEAGNADRLVGLVKDELRYNKETGHWYRWTGQLWAADGLPKLQVAVIDVAKQIGVEALELGGAEAQARKKALRHAERSLSARSIKNVMDLARNVNELLVGVEAFDFDPWMMCCANGSLDLRTGELRGWVKSDFMTYSTPVVFEPGFRAARWERFLEDVTGGDKELAGFLQKACGSSLTGVTSDEKLFFVHGQAATGKSTFIAAMQTVLGGYAAVANFESFLKSHGSGGGGGARSDIARLRGRRMVVSVEVDRGRELAEGLIKQMTGGDTMTVRHLYREEFEFDPQFKLWLVANHAPSMSGDDDAIWRRVLFVPFRTVVPESARDHTLKWAMRDPESDVVKAAFAWAVEGAVKWRLEGLGRPPQAVVEATADMRETMDTFGQWLAERCEIMEGERQERVKPAVLLASYNDWLRSNGHREVSQRTFGEKAAGRLEKIKNLGTFWYVGVKLKPYGYDRESGVVRFVPAS